MFQPDKLKDLLAPEAPVAPVQDPFSLDALIAWLRTKPSAEAYDYLDCKGACLIGKYMLHHDHKWYGDGLRYVGFCNKFDDAIGRSDTIGLIACGTPWTFGAALDRALEIKAKQS